MKLKSKGCNVYLIKDGDSTYLIDAGTDEGLISKQLKEIDGIIITHAHFDHYAAASALQREFGCPVYVHSEDIPFILGEKRMMYSGFLGLLARVGERIFRAEPPEDLKSIEKLNINATIIHTPGHTPGSYLHSSRGKPLLRRPAEGQERTIAFSKKLLLRLQPVCRISKKNFGVEFLRGLPGTRKRRQQS